MKKSKKDAAVPAMKLAAAPAAMKKSMKDAAMKKSMKVVKTTKLAAAPAAMTAMKSKKNVFYFKKSWSKTYDDQGGERSVEVSEDRGRRGRVYENWTWRRTTTD
jgi:hypothetical protein